MKEFQTKAVLSRIDNIQRCYNRNDCTTVLRLICYRYKLLVIVTTKANDKESLGSSLTSESLPSILLPTVFVFTRRKYSRFEMNVWDTLWIDVLYMSLNSLKT